MMQTRLAIGAAVLALTVAGAGRLEGQISTQNNMPLTPLPPSGDFVAPFFDGWYQNPDGTYTLSFGFFNRNTEQIVEIPVGPNNRVEPAEFDGNQPTYFPPVSYGGFSGRRERGVFAVNVPSDFGDKTVNWTITSGGHTWTVPGRVGVKAYELSYSPQAAGSLMPLVRVEPNGEMAYGRQGVWPQATLSARVGQPLTLWVYGEDRGERDDAEMTEVNATWIKHQGPVGENVTFEPRTLRTPVGGGELTTTATFTQPGEYVVRVRVDNFTTSDSSFADQCCWSNGYYRIRVTP
jgi:hypothetical protein